MHGRAFLTQCLPAHGQVRYVCSLTDLHFWQFKAYNASAVTYARVVPCPYATLNQACDHRWCMSPTTLITSMRVSLLPQVACSSPHRLWRRWTLASPHHKLDALGPSTHPLAKDRLPTPHATDTPGAGTCVVSHVRLSQQHSQLIYAHVRANKRAIELRGSCNLRRRIVREQISCQQQQSRRLPTLPCRSHLNRPTGCGLWVSDAEQSTYGSHHRR